MQFDDVLTHTVGDFGRWQKFLSFALGLFGIVGCLIVFDTVFTAGRPASWCSVPRQPGPLLAGLSPEQWRNLTLPWVHKQGTWRLDPCHRYSHNVSDVIGKIVSASDVTASPNVTGVPDVVVTSLRVLLNGTFVGNVSVERCEVYEYDNSTFQSTIVTEWDMVCESEYLSSMTKSIAMAGMMVGAGLGGFVADRFGRRRTTMITIPMVSICRLAQTFAPNLIFYNVFSFFCILCSMVSYAVLFTLVVELVGPSQRALVGSWLAQSFAIGYLLLIPLGYFLRSWRTLQGVIAGICFLAVGLVFIIPESPRWLLTQGDVAGARRVLRKLARLNGRTFPEDVTLTTEKTEKVGPDRIWHLCSSKWLALMNFLIFFAWFTAAFTYYGLSMNVGSLAGSIYLNMTISACLELLAYSVSQVAIGTRLGRKIPTSGFYILAGVAMLLTLCVPKDLPLVVTALTTFGRFCVCCLFNCIYIWTVELLPTGLRNSGLSANSCLGKIGAVLAPFAEQLVHIHPVMPIVSLGGLTLLCGILMLILPETRGKPLPQTMADITGSRTTKHPQAAEFEVMKA